jgi:hypothetical protein
MRAGTFAAGALAVYNFPPKRSSRLSPGDGQRAQLEIAIKFFMGYHYNGCYVHGLRDIARRYTGSLSRFWFDMATSVPLSYMDLYYLQVPPPRPPLRLGG